MKTRDAVLFDDQDEVQDWCDEHYNVGKWMLVI